MKPRAIVLVFTVALLALTTLMSAQSNRDTAEMHVAAAKAAAGQGAHGTVWHYL